MSQSATVVQELRNVIGTGHFRSSDVSKICSHISSKTSISQKYVEGIVSQLMQKSADRDEYFINYKKAKI